MIVCVGVATVVAVGVLALGLGEVTVGVDVGAQDTTARLRVKPLVKRIVELWSSFGKAQVNDFNILILLEKLFK
jgi:hypothetical protein